MKKITLFFLLITLLTFPASSFAQQELNLDTLRVDLWPELDSTSMLVIYRITLPSDTSFPINLTFRIPTSVGDPHAVAERQSGGSLVNLPYERQVNGDWATITFTTSMADIQLEYYDSRLIQQSGMRDYTFVWPGDYKVNNMIVQVQEPRFSENLNISPNIGSGVKASDGLSYYETIIGSLDFGATFSLSIQYDNPSGRLSTDTLAVEPSAPISTRSPFLSKIMDILPWFLGFLGLLLIAGGSLWYWQSSRKSAPSQGARKRRDASYPRTDRPGDTAIYCHKCGYRAEANDRFCRTCGTALR